MLDLVAAGEVPQRLREVEDDVRPRGRREAHTLPGSGDRERLVEPLPARVAPGRRPVLGPLVDEPQVSMYASCRVRYRRAACLRPRRAHTVQREALLRDPLDQAPLVVAEGWTPRGLDDTPHLRGIGGATDRHRDGGVAQYPQQRDLR